MQLRQNSQVRAGHDKLVGEVIRIKADRAMVQMHEETGIDETLVGIIHWR